MVKEFLFLDVALHLEDEINRKYDENFPSTYF